MNKNELINEVEYTVLVQSIIDYFKTISLPKSVFTAFLIKRCMLGSNGLGNRDYGIIDEVLPHLRTQFSLHSNDFSSILKAIHILKVSNYISVKGDILVSLNKKLDEPCEFGRGHIKLFEEIKKMNDIWFMEEVLSYV